MVQIGMKIRNIPYGYQYENGRIVLAETDSQIVREICSDYLIGSSMLEISDQLNDRGVEYIPGVTRWNKGRIKRILEDRRYTGIELYPAIIDQETYIVDCLSKKVKVNNGERTKYYVENNHPAIIDAATFARVQEELARRSGKRKVKQVGTKTEQGKYSSKYALTELLVCGECGTPYRRCTWTAGGQKRIVWRCISRLDYGKKYCHASPTMEEELLQEAIMTAIQKTALQNRDILCMLKLHIGMGLEGAAGEDRSLDIQVRIAELDAEFKTLLDAVSADMAEGSLNEDRMRELLLEKQGLDAELQQHANARQERENTKSRLNDICNVLEALANHPMTFDDHLVRQILECVVVESKEQIKVVFTGGLEITEQIG
ncbi:recombinase family protein [Ruthenibacterium lactatiformans]|uniref:recombinase family protein n=1 Tax=Ruthenibacterium lactatiformans TaxID=1550024 RepID=UPI0030801AE4